MWPPQAGLVYNWILLNNKKSDAYGIVMNSAAFWLLPITRKDEIKDAMEFWVPFPSFPYRFLSYYIWLIIQAFSVLVFVLVLRFKKKKVLHMGKVMHRPTTKTYAVLMSANFIEQ